MLYCFSPNRSHDENNYPVYPVILSKKGAGASRGLRRGKN